MTNIQTPEWVKDAVFYQIFPDRFAFSHRLPKPGNLQRWGATPTPHGFQGGDLAGVIERLDYLSDLGVNALYFNPIFASASNHRYHTFDYYQVDPLLGGNAIFRELLDAAHARGMRVVLDGVFNHASRGFFQFNHLMECGPESPYIDWFHVHGWPIRAFEGEKALNYAAWWDIPALPKFNTDTPAVREFLWDVATYWLEQGIDGWRLDVPEEIDDDAFWQEFRRRCLAVNPDCYIVGELWKDAERWLQGDQFDAQMNYLFTRAGLAFFLGERMDQSETGKMGYGLMEPLDGAAFSAEIERITNDLYAWPIVQAQMTMLGSHDTPRLMTLARGDSAAVARLFTCQMTLPGAPNIYYGDEIGLIGGNDPDCRHAFPWGEPGSWNHDLRRHVQGLIVLRHATPALRRGRYESVIGAGDVVVYARHLPEQSAVIAFNAGQTVQEVGLPASADLPPTLTRAFGSAPARTISPGDTLTLPPGSGTIWVGTR
jgi:neopullulanase